MIILDTHIWIWWVHGDPTLSKAHRDLITGSEQSGIGISPISCWEVAKLVERQRLVLPEDVQNWMRQALSYPGIQLLELTPEICIESTRLPGDFHRDPADQLIVATSRILRAPLVTADQKILKYPHVRIAKDLDELRGA